MKRRGSALLIAMMLIAAVGGVAFGVARLIYAETSTSEIYENGSVAYYSAESGLEEGFLRFKYNRNALVPFNNWTLNEKKGFRTNLSSNTALTGSATNGTNFSELLTTTSSTLTPDKQAFDLRIGYLGTKNDMNAQNAPSAPSFLPIYGQDVNYWNSDEVKGSNSYGQGAYSFLTVPRDEAIKIDLTGFQLASNPLNLYMKFLNVGGNTDANKCNALAEVKFLVDDGTGTVQEFKEIYNFNSATCAPLLGMDQTELMSNGVTGSQINSFTKGGSTQYDFYYKAASIDTNIFTRAKKAFSTTIGSGFKYSISIKPLYYDMTFALVPNSCEGAAGINACKTVSTTIPGPFSTVTTVGYYGGTTRTLEANIDRQSGTLYDLYDYVLYKGS